MNAEAMRVCRWLVRAFLLFSASYFRSICVLVAFALLYFFYSSTGFPHGGSAIGLMYGVIGLIFIVVLMYYGIRKRSYRHASVDLQGWLRSHFSLGVLVVFVVLFHSGFRFHDKVAVTALIIMLAVFASGLLGAIIYAMVPPRLIGVESNLSASTISDEINHLAEAIRRLAANKSGEFQRACDAVIQTERPSSFAGWQLLRPSQISRRFERNDLIALFGSLRGIPASEQGDLMRLRELAQQMRDLHDRLIRKQRYVNIMSAWLFLHVPLSLAMIVAIVAHITGAIYYWGLPR
jgi:hypothetical protein